MKGGGRGAGVAWGGSGTLSAKTPRLCQPPPPPFAVLAVLQSEASRNASGVKFDETPDLDILEGNSPCFSNWHTRQSTAPWEEVARAMQLLTTLSRHALCVRVCERGLRQKSKGELFIRAKRSAYRVWDRIGLPDLSLLHDTSAMRRVFKPAAARKRAHLA